MNTWGKRILIFLGFVIFLFGIKFILFNVPISTGKRVGNLTKISKKGKFPLFKTWEGTLDEGSGEQLTSFFSVKNDDLAQEMYEYEGRQVIIFYEQYFIGWPRETNYNVVSWKSKDSESSVGGDRALRLLSKTLFCSFLGSLHKNEGLYRQVKDYIKDKNVYIFNQYQKCND